MDLINGTVLWGYKISFIHFMGFDEETQDTAMSPWIFTAICLQGFPFLLFFVLFCFVFIHNVCRLKGSRYIAVTIKYQSHLRMMMRSRQL